MEQSIRNILTWYEFCQKKLKDFFFYKLDYRGINIRIGPVGKPGSDKNIQIHNPVYKHVLSAPTNINITDPRIAFQKNLLLGCDVVLKISMSKYLFRFFFSIFALASTALFKIHCSFFNEQEFQCMRVHSSRYLFR